MRKYSFLFTLLLLSASSFAQNKDFSYKFYGQVRTDLYYNSRANEETVDGLFYMYPKDKIYDTDGKEYLDFAAGFAVTGLGYDNKELNEALKKQIDKLYHTCLLYTSPSPRDRG